MMASVVAGGNRKKSLTLRGVDPETCMIVFKNHWAQVVKILEKHEPGRSACSPLSFLLAPSAAPSGGAGSLRLGSIPPDEASAVQNYVEHMLFLLMEEEAGQGGAMGPILELVVMEGVMERLFLWSLRRHFTEDMKLEQLRMYQMLLSQARQPLLHHKPILRPLMMLLASCAGSSTDSGGAVEAELLSLLKQLCVSLVGQPSVLELFFYSTQDQGAANFLLFSLLIPYTHRQGSVGKQARDSLLFIMSLSASEHRVARHIADSTYFCPVLATGLSGLYSSLPAKLQVYSEDWHFLEEADWLQVPALVHFLHSLEFCSAVIKVAHPSIRCQLLGYIYNGFLVPVLAPALHKLTVEEVMTTTAYLDLFLRSISEPALLHTFLSFVLLHEHDNVHILDTLVSRVNTPFQLGTVSLSLFRTLIGLFCEDVMLQLVLRYLLPCEHLSEEQRPLLAQRDCYSCSASDFLLLTPSWCPLGAPHRAQRNQYTPHHAHHAHHARYTHHPAHHTEHIHWPKGADVSISEGDSVGYYRASDFPMSVNYLHYLWDARRAISSARSACRLWSAPYDGVSPPRRDRRSEGREEAGSRVKSGSFSSSAATPPPAAASPDPDSSSDTVSVFVGNQPGRAGSALDELEWDDMFSDTPPPGGAALSPTPPPAPPRHIQAMRHSANILVRGAYVEESDFQDDVLVYDLVARRDARTAPGRRSVTDAVNSIMSSRRRSEEERRRTEEGEEERRRTEEGEEERKRGHGLSNGHAVREEEDAGGGGDDGDGEAEDEDEGRKSGMKLSPRGSFDTPSSRSNSVPNGHSEYESHDPPLAAAAGDAPRGASTPAGGGEGFLSRYRELMLSLGAEPDGEDAGDDLATFGRRVQALRRKQEDEGLEEEEDFHPLWNGGLEGGGEEEEEQEEEGSRTGGDRKQGVLFTGPFISVLLSRLENLLENSIAVNLLVTGILAQLASYPQPLLRSFLLSTRTHDQSKARTLHQVLASLHVQIENYVSTRPDYVAMVTQAWRFLLAKDQDQKVKEHFFSGPEGAAATAAATAHPNGALGRRSCPSIPAQDKSRVFAIVLYAEFLKELAAIAQEHSITADWSGGD